MWLRVHSGIDNDRKNGNQPPLATSSNCTYQRHLSKQVWEDVLQHGTNSIEYGIQNGTQGIKPVTPSVHGCFRRRFVTVLRGQISVNGILDNLNFIVFEFNKEIRQFIVHDMAVLTIHASD